MCPASHLCSHSPHFYTSAQSTCDHMKSMLDEKDVALGKLEEKLRLIDLDMAILIADRGR